MMINIGIEVKESTPLAAVLSALRGSNSWWHTAEFHHDRSMPVPPAHYNQQTLDCQKMEMATWFFGVIGVWIQDIETKIRKVPLCRILERKWTTFQCLSPQPHPDQVWFHSRCLEDRWCKARAQSIRETRHPRQPWNIEEWYPYQPSCCGVYAQSSLL